MTATKRRIALDIVATDTHCGEECEHFDAGWAWCDEFRENPDSEDGQTFKRLPECIAAEKAQGGGGGE